MSAFKGTPGPWSTPHFAEPDVDCQCGFVLTERHFGAVATVHCSGDGDDIFAHGDNPKFEQAVANARLIAAAPELLEALEQLIGPEDDPKAGWRGWTPSTEMFRCEFCGQEDLDCGRIQHDDRCPIKAARSAIAQATGEQS